mgnify:CR=1 FL=1
MIAHLTPDDCLEGGNEAGAYLETLKLTDMAQLSEDQWRTFCILLVNGANKAAGKRIVGAWLAPFE